jgi:hypothetical protein
LVSVILILDVGGNSWEFPDELFEEVSDHVFGFLFPTRMIEEEIQKTELRGFAEPMKEDRSPEIRDINQTDADTRSRDGIFQSQLKDQRGYADGHTLASANERGRALTSPIFVVLRSHEPLTRFHGLEKAVLAPGRIYFLARSIRGYEIGALDRAFGLAR